MKYMLIMSGTRAGFDQFMTWPKELLAANFAFMQAFAKKLGQQGELISTHGLAAPAHARRVTADKDGKPISDGVFPESKEFLAGFWLVDVASPERAYEIAAEISTAPGSGGGALPDKFWIEVREVMG